MKDFFKKNHPIGKKVLIFVVVLALVAGSYIYIGAKPAHADVMTNVLGSFFGMFAGAGTQAAVSAAAPVVNAVSGTWNNLVTFIFAVIAYEALSLGSFLVGIAALLLNFVINQTILNMASFVNTSNGINVGWQIIRDAGNLIFIFFFIYVAIKTILGLANGQTKRLVAYMIIFGLLVNFSLFFTKVIIDGSNILTAGFFNLSIGNTAGQDPNAFGISNTFMQDLGLPGVWDSTGPNAVLGAATLTVAAGQQSPSLVGMLWKVIVIGVAGTAFFIITAITFLIAAALLVVRFVILIFLMILAPVGYLGYILPQTKSYASKWWKTLISQCLFAPLYMILIYLVLILAQNLNSLNISPANLNMLATIGQASGTSLNPIGAPIGSILNFVIIIIFMNAATFLAMQVATSSGGITAQAMEWGRRQANRVTSAVGRNTAGRVGRLAGQGYDIGEAKIKDSKFAKGLNKYTGGAAGFVTRTVSRSARETLGSVESSKYTGTQNLADVQKYYKTRDKELADVSRQRQRKGIIDAGINPTATGPALKNLADEIRKMTAKEIETQDIKVLTSPAFASRMAVAQWDTLFKSDAWDDKQKADMKAARDKGFETWATTDPAGLLEKRSSEDISKLPLAKFKLQPGVLENVAVNLSRQDLQKIFDNPNVDAATRTAIKTTIEAKYLAEETRFNTEIAARTATIASRPGGVRPKRENVPLTVREDERLRRAHDYFMGPAGSIF
jgi:hypothetical protein